MDWCPVEMMAMLRAVCDARNESTLSGKQSYANLGAASTACDTLVHYAGMR
jgi:hypothetical protein